MGIKIPEKIAKGDISKLLEGTPKLTEKQIETFIGEAQKLIKQ